MARSSAFIVEQVVDEEAEEVRSAVDWTAVRAMHADGVGKRGIARRLGISRDTVDKLIEATEPPCTRGRRRVRCSIDSSRCCGAVLQLHRGEMPTRPRMAGRERRVETLVATLPYSGA